MLVPSPLKAVVVRPVTVDVAAGDRLGEDHPNAANLPRQPVARRADEIELSEPHNTEFETTVGATVSITIDLFAPKDPAAPGAGRVRLAA